MRPWLTGWVALGLALAAVAAALAVSAFAAERFGLVFHFHPAAVVVGGAWLAHMSSRSVSHSYEHRRRRSPYQHGRSPDEGEGTSAP